MAYSPTGKQLSIEQDSAHVRISLDDRFIGSLVPMKSKEDSLFEMPKENDLTILPTNFVNFLIQAFSCTGDGKDKLVLSGVNVSSKGIAATDGKQLFHLPLPLQLKSDVTIPPSRCYAALKGMRWFSLAHWRNVYGNSMFAIVGEGFRYVAKAIDGTYPNYHQVISASENSDVTFTLTPEGARSLSAFINDDKNDAFFDLAVHPDRIELQHEYDITRKGTFGAVSRSTNLPCKVRINTCYLRQFLKMGFMSMSLSSKSPSPLVSTSGVGKYLFMPCGSANRNSASAPTQATTSAPTPAASPKPSVNPATISITATNKTIQTTTNKTIQTSTNKTIQTSTNKTIQTSTNNQKEKPTMTQAMTTPTAIRPTAAFEDAAFEVFKPSLDARCERDSNDNSEASRYQCGFLRHNPTLTEGAPRLGFHIANFCTPASFFDYPDYMKGCFLMLLDRAEHIFHATEIGTGTWLNSMPRWLKWFPQEWRDNMGEPLTNIQWHYGFWGQFITARKTFNAKYGQILRSTGKFPFYPCASFCNISSMRNHLEKRNQKNYTLLYKMPFHVHSGGIKDATGQTVPLFGVNYYAPFNHNYYNISELVKNHCRGR